MEKKNWFAVAVESLAPFGHLHSRDTKFGPGKMFTYFLHLLPLLLKITLFITCCKIYFQRRWTRCYRTQRVSCYPEWKLHFLYVWTFWFTCTSGNKVFRLVAVYRPPASKENGFTVERCLSEFSVFLEELNSTSSQFLLCGDFKLHVDDNTNASQTIPRPCSCWSKTAC